MLKQGLTSVNSQINLQSSMISSKSSMLKHIRPTENSVIEKAEVEVGIKESMGNDSNNTSCNYALNTSLLHLNKNKEELCDI
jgi:hypothetical protein